MKNKYKGANRAQNEGAQHIDNQCVERENQNQTNHNELIFDDLTFGELKDLFNPEDIIDWLPSKKYLEANGTALIQKELSVGSITVYTWGVVVYDTGTRCSVLRIDEITAMNAGLDQIKNLPLPLEEIPSEIVIYLCADRKKEKQISEKARKKWIPIAEDFDQVPEGEEDSVYVPMDETAIPGEMCEDLFDAIAITAGIAYVLVTWPRIVIITVIAVYAAITLIGVLSRVRHKLGHGLDRGHSQRHSVDNYAPTATDKSDESGESEATDEPDELDSADVIHFQWLPFLEVSNIEKYILSFYRLFCKKTLFVWTIHCLYPHDYNVNRKKAYKKRCCNVIPLFDKIIVHTNSYKEELVKNYQVREEIVSIIFGGVYVPNIDTTSNQKGNQGVNQEARQDTTQDAKKPIKYRILHFGGLSLYKGTDLFIDALNSLSNEEKNKIEVKIMGAVSDSFYKDLLKKSAGLPIEWFPYMVPDDFLNRSLSWTDLIVLVKHCHARGIEESDLQKGFMQMLLDMKQNIEAVKKEFVFTNGGNMDMINPILRKDFEGFLKALDSMPSVISWVHPFDEALFCKYIRRGVTKEYFKEDGVDKDAGKDADMNAGEDHKEKSLNENLDEKHEENLNEKHNEKPNDVSIHYHFSFNMEWTAFGHLTSEQESKQKSELEQCCMVCS